jgi:hypothetical protein
MGREDPDPDPALLDESFFSVPATRDAAGMAGEEM